MTIVIALAYTLNLLDAGLTAGALSAGLATEANPLMDYFWSISPYAFLAAKVFGALCFFVTLYVYRTNRLARAGAWASLILYCIVLCVHMRGMHA